MSRHHPHPDQLPIAFGQSFGQSEAIEHMIEARAAIQAEGAAIRWRFRLILIESVMMTALVTGAGLAMKYPASTVLKNAGMVGAACLLTGLLLIGLSALTGHLVSRFLTRRRASSAMRSPRS